MRLSCRGGDAGGVAGRPPGEHTGMCLLGMAAGVPRDEVLSDRCDEGVDERAIGNGLATAAAMLASQTFDECSRRYATWDSALYAAGELAIVSMVRTQPGSIGLPFLI